MLARDGKGGKLFMSRRVLGWSGWFRTVKDA